MGLCCEAIVFLGYKIPKEIADKVEENMSILSKENMFIYMGDYTDDLDIKYFGKIIKSIEFAEEAIEFESILCGQRDFDEVVKAFNQVFKDFNFEERPALKKYLFCRYG